MALHPPMLMLFPPQIGWSEYLELYITKLGLVDIDDIEALKGRFNSIDVDGSGVRPHRLLPGRHTSPLIPSSRRTVPLSR